MEPISEILRRQIQRNTTNKDTDTLSNAEPETDMGPVCTICKGAKFVHPRLPSGKPDYSQVIPCRCVDQESDKERQTRLRRYSNLGLLAHLTFDNLRPQGKSDNPANQEQFSQAYQAARGFAAEPKGWFVLTGPSGSGKTHLAVAIANHCITSNHPVFYITVPDLLDHLRSSFNPGSELPYDEFFEQVRNAPLLILDDLGIQSSTPWAKEKLDQLLNHRFINQIPTVIISIGHLEELEERLRTRLVASDVCQTCAFEEGLVSPFAFSWAPEFELQKSMTFDSFDSKRVNLPLEQRDNLREAFRVADEFAKSPGGWLVLQGPSGCGKTHLAAAIVNYRYQVKKQALFIVVPDFLDHLRSSFSPESKISYDRFFEGVKNAPLLVLDDLGKQSTTPWAQEKLYQVINHRYNARFPTVITTNLSTDEMDSPIASRLADPSISLFFTITAPNNWADRPSQTQIPRGGRRGYRG